MRLYPSLGQDLKAAGIGSLYDLQLPSSDAPDHERHLFTGIAAISKDAFDEGEQSSRPAQQLEGTVAVLNISRMDDDVQQEAERVDEDVPLAARDLLARIVALRVDPGPPFCAARALWLSMIATEGLASRPAASRQAT